MIYTYAYVRNFNIGTSEIGWLITIWFCNMYRSMKGMKQLEDPRIKVPAMLIMGEEDYCLKFPGMEEYIRSGVVKHFVPDLEVIFVPEGSHFVHEQFPVEVNGLIIPFLNKHVSWAKKMGS